ncbi:MAG: indolepyruvate ferredoxin oxidoreductase family protein [Proteobacteria bacterium]|nr:indolepyruvate ferredoxin oxidoreductase family protein [Pseudomonadota bacterium]
MALAAVTLDDKYALESGRVFLTGTQALVRLPIMQRQRDAAAGLNTACFISGYRGSPLGGFDRELWRAKPFIENNHIHFQPGVNEDLAATAVWGSQQVGLYPGARYDGVFAMWYGKGPGVDRSGDAFKHANNAGTARLGGVLALAGDDHTCKSSTLPHQSEYAFMDASIPVLNPAGVQEFLDLGLYGWAMSRYAGVWVGFKTIAETVDSSASVHVDPHRVEIAVPDDYEMPEGGLNIRWPDPPLDQERRLHEHKLYAALAFARANRLDGVAFGSSEPRFGIVTCGKSYLDVRQALEDLGIDEALAREIGLAVYKVALTWPLEREGVRRFAEGLDELLVVEEKRALIENQLKEQLYNWDAALRPRVIGKFDEDGAWILPSIDELTPARIARVIARRIGRFFTSERIVERLAFLEAKEAALADRAAPIERLPYFCSGCPHNTSTRVPEGSRAMAGIGCHYMVQWMDRDTDTFTQMGAEGATWIGQAPFTETPHVFQNIGDGTYFHSGLLAIRAALAAEVNITYKLLYNDAVAMTGGQPIDGQLTVPQITHQLYGEGVRRLAVVSDEPGKYPRGAGFAKGVTIHHRDELDRVQREMRDRQGVSVLIYDQTCAAELRRRRKRGVAPDRDRRVVINAGVCEGCGDCGVASNCLSVIPLETEFGRKRTIDQSSCNKDFSCLNGFCPSFVTVHGGRLRKPEAPARDAALADLPAPTLPALDAPYGILVTGVGGTGVVTIGALLGMAAHIEGLGVSVLDMTGLAQKYGAVISHLRIAAKPEDINAVRVAAGGARLLLGCDLIVAGGFDALAKIAAGETHAIVNSHESPTGEFTRKPDLAFPVELLRRRVSDAAGPGHAEFLDATGLATALLGDAIASNLFLVGYAWQKGLVPLSGEAIERAIELNGVAVEMNRRAFRWGRLCAHDRAAVEAAAAEAAPATAPDQRISASLGEIIERRLETLTKYQNAAYAERYKNLVERVGEAEAERAKGLSGLTEAVARYYFKLLAYKDEYEVARLFTDGAFLRRVEAQFEGDYRLEFHLAPPLLAKRDPETGRLRKSAYGAWMLSAFRLLAKLKGLRGTPFDPFGYATDRRTERRLITEYEAVVAELIANLDHDNHALAVEIASIPEHIRGYGHVKQAHLDEATAREAELLAAFRAPSPQADAAE